MNLDIPIIFEKKKECLVKFDELKNNKQVLRNHLEVINDVDDWKLGKNAFCVYPIPFWRERSGSVTGTVSKKKFTSLEGVNTDGCCSFGFIDNKHRITLLPTRGKFNEISISFFEEKNDSIFMTGIGFNYVEFNGNKLAIPEKSYTSLTLLEEFFWLDKVTQISIAVTIRGDVIVEGYRYSDQGLLVSSICASDSELVIPEYSIDYFYTENDSLDKVVSRSTQSILWQKKRK